MKNTLKNFFTYKNHSKKHKISLVVLQNFSESMTKFSERISLENAPQKAYRSNCAKFIKGECLRSRKVYTHILADNFRVVKGGTNYCNLNGNV